jgi:KAP family P-loop domain
MGVLERNGNVTDIAMRDLGREGRSEPAALSFPAIEAQAKPAKRGSIFATDLPRGVDALGLGKALRPLAELAAHRDAETPLTIAFLGESGSGKSFALTKLLAEIEALSAAAVSTGSPFLTRIANLRIDVGGFDGEPSVALAGALYDKLGVEFPEFVREVAHAVRDPQIVAREAAERLDEARGRLDAEHQKLDEIESRRARLAETVLFESAGSQVDAYARANRAKIESRLEGFGITGDPIANYKSMVRDIAESGGLLGRVGGALRAFWAFKGQTRLLVTAAILALVGFGLDAAVADQAKWLASLRGASQGLASLATWIEAHIDWLTLAAKIAYAAAVLALVANFLRGVQLLRPLFRGVGLLETDVLNRRRALDALYAHQMRRVDGLEADVELAARSAAEADRRAGTPAPLKAQAEVSPFADSTLKAQAERFFAALGAFMEGVQRNGAVAGGLKSVPERLVVALDHVDALPQGKARALLEAAHRAFASPGTVTLVAVDPARIEADAAALEKWIQVPFRLEGAGAADHAAFVAQVIGQADAAGTQTRTEVWAPLDWSISAAESGLLAAVAPLAGGSPRAVKRLVNLYRIARPQAREDKSVLAMMLALEQGGTSHEIATVKDAVGERDSDADFEIEHATPRLFAVFQMLRAVEGRVSVESARRAVSVAKMFSLRA